MNNNLLLGLFFALMAALLNASIGIFSKILISHGLNPQSIAFFKTVLAFVIVSLMLSGSPRLSQKRMLSDNPHQPNMSLFTKIAICAFLGIFVLFFFETAAYQYGAASNVVVILMASAASSALIFEVLILRQQLLLSSIVGVSLAVLGIFVISWLQSATSIAMVANAVMAGAGYGLFSVLLKKFGLNGGLYLTKFLLLFGSVYLLLPYLLDYQAITINATVLGNLAALAILPTIFGFYCTTRALNHLSASKVQVAELSEPIFVAVLAWLVLGELPTLQFFIGATLIVLGIAIINGLHRSLVNLANN